MLRSKAELAQRSKALTHPLRVKLVYAWAPGRVASPSELAEEIGEPLEQVGYHVRRLAEWGCLEFVEDRDVGGVVEHFYRVAERPYYDDEAWEALTPAERAIALRGFLSDILADIAGTEVDGALDARLEAHISRSPLELDDRGWKELDALLWALLDHGHEVGAAAAGRVASGESSYPEFASAQMLLIAFPAAPRAGDPQPSGMKPLGFTDAGSSLKRTNPSTLAERYKALSHPLRAAIVSALADGRVASPSELAKEFGVPLSSVSYHARQLKTLGCLELIEKRKRRTTVEHFYGVRTYPFYDLAAWQALHARERATAARDVLTNVLAEILTADAAGVLDGQHEFHLTRSPLELDDRGWGDLDDLMVDALSGVREIAAQAAGRATRGDHEPDGLRPARLVMLLLPTPSSRKKGGRRTE
jgi:DNA-binding transcriptional ArsR family regulator